MERGIDLCQGCRIKPAGPLRAGADRSRTGFAPSRARSICRALLGVIGLATLATARHIFLVFTGTNGADEPAASRSGEAAA
jgi:hypothetical protein